MSFSPRTLFNGVGSLMRGLLPNCCAKIDQVNPEEGVGGNDAADALRYLAATKLRMVTERKPREL
jgi:hypothetical protein